MKYRTTRYSANKVAELLGVYKRTLFNWEAAGKIPKAKRDPMNNYRYYLDDDIEELRKITKR
jgi:DNA-binding transcriptional MerR regulator